MFSQGPPSPPLARFAADAGHLAPHTHATPTTVQGSELMRFAAAGAATLLIGGDLIVTVCQVKIAHVIAPTTPIKAIVHACIQAIPALRSVL